MRVTVYGTSGEDRATWEAAVRRMPGRDVYFLPGYAAAYEAIGDGRALCFHVTDGGREGIEVLMVRSADGLPFLGGAETGLYDAVSPYGYGGPLLNDAAVSDPGFRRTFFMTLREWARQEKIVARFVRFHPLLENAALALDALEVWKRQPTVYMQLDGEVDLLAQFTSSARAQVRQAARAGVTFAELGDEDGLRAFHEMYEATMTRAGAADYYHFPWEYYRSLKRGLGDGLRTCAALVGGQPAAMALFMAEGEWAHYHLGASDPRFLAKRPNNLLLYEAGKIFRAEGKRVFHLGGGLTGEDSLYHFKKGLGKGRARFATGREILLPAEYADLVARWEVWAGAKADPAGFFPAYRAPRPREGR